MAKRVKPCADRLAFPTFLAATPVRSSDLDCSPPNVASDPKKNNLPLSVPTVAPPAQTRWALSLEPSLVFRHSIPGFLACASSRVPRTQEELSGTNWRSNLRVASGSCSPAAPVKVYVLSNPWGPRLAFPNSHCPAIRRWSLASLLVCRLMHARSWP
jgi:hypothetical protein